MAATVQILLSVRENSLRYCQQMGSIAKAMKKQKQYCQVSETRTVTMCFDWRLHQMTVIMIAVATMNILNKICLKLMVVVFSNSPIVAIYINKSEFAVQCSTILT